MVGYNNNNSYLPQTYTSYAYGGQPSNMTMVQPQAAQNQVNAINWVQGEAGAKSVLVPPGQKVLLMDSETNVFYVKSSDISGMPLPLRVFEYKEVTEESKIARPPEAYVTREEFDRVINELKANTPPLIEEKKNEFVI